MNVMAKIKTFEGCRTFWHVTNNTNDGAKKKKQETVKKNDCDGWNTIKGKKHNSMDVGHRGEEHIEYYDGPIMVKDKS